MDTRPDDVQVLPCPHEHTRGFHTSRRLLLLAFTLFAGCGEEDRTPFDYTPSADRVATSGDDTTRAPAPVATFHVPAPAPPLRARLTAALMPAGNDAPSGTMRLEGVGSRATVTTEISGGTGGRSYTGSIRQGECVAVGSRVAVLVPITADSTGSGSSYSSVSIDVGDLLRAPHVVTYGRDGSFESCGALGSATPLDTLPAGS